MAGDPFTAEFHAEFGEGGGSPMIESSNLRLTSPSGFIVDSRGTTWRLVTSAIVSNGMQVLRNGAIDPSTKHVVTLQYYSHYVWRTEISATYPAPGHWWVWMGTSWTDRGPVPGAAPVVTAPPLGPTDVRIA